LLLVDFIANYFGLRIMECTIKHSLYRSLSESVGLLSVASPKTICKHCGYPVTCDYPQYPIYLGLIWLSTHFCK